MVAADIQQIRDKLQINKSVRPIYIDVKEDRARNEER